MLTRKALSLSLLLLAVCLLIQVDQISADDSSLVLHPNPISSTNFKELYKATTLIFSVEDDGSYAYVAGGKGGVFVVSLKNPQVQEVVQHIPLYHIQHCLAKGNYLFTSDQFYGVNIYDITDRKNAVKIVTIDAQVKNTQYVNVTKDLRYLYILGNGMVYCYDLLDIANPVFITAVGVPTPYTFRIKFNADETYFVVSNHMGGVQIIDVRNRLNPIIRVSKNPSLITWDAEITYDGKALYALDAYFGLYYADLTGMYDLPIGSTTLFPVTYKNVFASQTLNMCLTLTKDGKHVLVGLRSIGIYLFSITDGDYSKITFVQHLQGSYMTLAIQMSPLDEKLLFASNGISLIIYSVVSPNLNQDFPNMLNTFQSSLIPKTLMLLPGQLICLNDGQHLIVVNNNDNTEIISIADRYAPKAKSVIPRTPDRYYYFSVAVSPDENLLIITAQATGFYTYDITDKAAPVFKSWFMPLPKGNNVLGATFNKEGTAAAITNGFTGVHIIGFTNPAVPSRLEQFVEMQACGFQKCAYLSDSIRMLCSCREIGVFFFEVIGTQLVKKAIFTEIASEVPILSSDETKAYVCNGFQGIFILDITDFDHPKQLSQLILKGWTQKMYPLFDEKYLIVSDQEKGQLSLINIENPLNPYVQQLVEFQSESSTSVCVTPDEKTTYFTGVMGLRSLPIQTDLKIHTQIQVEVLDSNGKFKYYNTLEVHENLLVGQKAYFTFVPLYTSRVIKIKNVKYYRYFEKQDLPSWITFLPTKGQIFMTVDKRGVVNDFSTEKKGENIIILEVLTSISKSDFLETGLIDTTLAARLLAVLKEQNYLNSNAQLTDKLDPTVDFVLDFYDNGTFAEANYNAAQKAAILYKVKKVLVFSKIDYPIRFFIISSLKFAYVQSEARALESTTETGTVISTPSTQVTVFLQILAQGKFVKKTFEGVLTSFSDDLTSVQISGQTSYVNAIMAKNIQVSNSTENISDVKFYITVSDSSNYDLQINTDLSSLKFASIHQPVLENTQKSLQSQLNRVYDDAEVQIVERFSFSIDSNSFLQADRLPITYSAFLIGEDGTETEILTGEWIEFNSASLTFSGIRIARYYRTVARIKVVASDGYSDASSEFEMKFNIIPFFYAIQLAISVLGPLLGIIGFWQYRHEIHLFVAERKNMYSDETAIIGRKYKKQIVLLDEIQTDGTHLWGVFFKKNKNIFTELQEEYKKNQCINIAVLMERIEKVYVPIQQQYSSIDPREFDFEDSRLVRVIKRIVFENLLRHDEGTYKAFLKLKSHAIDESNPKDWYKMYLQIVPKLDIVNNRVVRKKFDENNEQQLETTNQLLQQGYNNAGGGISMRKMADDIEPVEEYPGSSERPIQSKRLISTTDRLSKQFFKGIKSDENMVTDKELELDNHNNNGLDEQKEQYSDLNPFPEMIINQDAILNMLNKIQFKAKYDFSMLVECIALEASGFLHAPPSSLTPAVGESLHLCAHELYTLQAFRKNKGGMVQKILDFMNMGYTPIGLVKNNPLPKWLNYQIVDGIINMWGVPNPSDETEILIRIINSTLITVHSFRIIIQDKEGNDCRDKNLLRRATHKLNIVNSYRRSTKQMMPHSSTNIYAKQHISEIAEKAKQLPVNAYEMTPVKENSRDMKRSQNGAMSDMVSSEKDSVRQKSFSSHSGHAQQVPQVPHLPKVSNRNGGVIKQDSLESSIFIEFPDYQDQNHEQQQEAAKDRQEHVPEN